MKLKLQSAEVPLILALLFGVSVILGLAWQGIVRQPEQVAARTAELHARVLATMAAAQLEAAGPNSVVNDRRNALRRSTVDGELAVAFLIDPGFLIFAATDPDLESRPYPETPWANAISPGLLVEARAASSIETIRTNGFLACIHPLALGTEPLNLTPAEFSSLILIFDRRTSEAMVGAQAKSLFNRLAFAVVLAAVGVWAAVKLLLLRRIRALNQAARRIAKGDFSTETRLPGQDEVAQLSQSINQVAAWVENSTAALRDSERSYRELVESSNDLIWSADGAGRWTFVNRAAVARIYGCKPEEMLGRRIASFATPESEADNVAMFEQIDKGQEHLYLETSHFGKHRQVVYLSFTGIVHRDDSGQVESLSGIVRDNTRRWKAEEQVREQASLLDLANDAIFVRDLDDRVLFWNRGSEMLLGWTRDEAVGKQATALAFKDLESVAAAQQAVLDQDDWIGELRPVHKDGREIIVSSRWTLVRDAQGRPKSMLCINTDITEKKQLEAQFLRVQRLEGIGTLASGIAHDLNNVFSPITISLALLKGKIKDPSADRMLGILGSSARRGADIVKQLLTFARGSEGKMGLLQPTHILKELANIIKGTFPKSIQFELNTSKGLWPVVGDATRLHQVLLNLCINARDAMAEGGSLQLLADNLEVDEHFARLQPEARPGPYVVVEISDTGSGIAPEHLQRIFDPFFTTKEPGKGTGLGLSSAIGIVRSHGGFITVKSTPGRGTSFKVHLPAQPAETGGSLDDLEAPPPLGNGELLLVVDDEEAVRQATAETLEYGGYRVLTASNGDEGAKVFHRHSTEIAAILTDLMMPGYDGVHLIRAVREQDLGVPLLVSTGLEAGKAAARVEPFGIAAILEKPYTGVRLLEAVHEAIELRRQELGERTVEL